MTSLFDFISNFSPDDLARESATAAQQLQEAEDAIVRANETYQRVQARKRFIDSALKLLESRNGHSPNGTSAVASPAPDTDGADDKTAYILLMIQKANGLKPGQVFEKLIAEGVPVRRPYVSTVLMRLKRRGQIFADETGRYFAR